MSKVFQLELVSRIETLTDLNAGIDEFARLNDLGKTALFDLRLVLEELIVNVINYAFDDPEAGHPILIEFEMVKYGESVGVKIQDHGRAFNPLLEIPEIPPDPAAGQSGGLGFFLVRQKTRDLEYKRRDSKVNQVTFWVDSGKGISKAEHN